MKTKRILQLLMATLVFTFSSCSKDEPGNSEIPDGNKLTKGVHKIEVTVTSQFSEITTILSYAGVGKDGKNANATLYNESGEKCADGAFVRTVEKGKGKFICYTNSDATGLLCSLSVLCLEKGSSASAIAVAYINEKEVSRIEKTFTEKNNDIFSIQTFK